MISSITVPDTYRYNTERIPFDFVSENNCPGVLPNSLDSFFTIEDTVFICLGFSDASVSGIVHPQVPVRGLERIRERQIVIIRRAKEIRATLGDPLVELARILRDIPVEDDMWDRIVQEPYG